MSENLSDHEQITCNNIKTLLSQKLPNVSGDFNGNIDNFLNFYNYISNHIERIISPSKASSSLNCLEMPYVLLTFNVNNIKNDSPLLSDKIYEYKYLLNKYDIHYNDDKTNIITFNLGENCSWISPESNVIASHKQITFELSKNNIIENSINDESENNSDDSEQYCLKVRAIASVTESSIDLVTILFNKKIFTKDNIIEKNLGINTNETYTNKIINIRLDCFKCNTDPINKLCKKKYIYDRRKRCYILYDDYINCNC